MSIPSPAEIVALLHLIHPTHGRTFILLDQPAPADVKLEVMDKHPSYDMTSIADAPVLADARTFTLSYEGAICKVSSTKQVYLAPWGQNPQRAIEVDVSKCKNGDHSHMGFAFDAPRGNDKVTASAPTEGKPDDAMVTWAETHTARVVQDSPYTRFGKALSVQKLSSGAEALSVSFKDGGGSSILVRKGDDELLRLSSGTILGEIKWEDHTYLVSYEGGFKVTDEHQR